MDSAYVEFALQAEGRQIVPGQLHSVFYESKRNLGERNDGENTTHGS